MNKEELAAHRKMVKDAYAIKQTPEELAEVDNDLMKMLAPYDSSAPPTGGSTTKVNTVSHKTRK